MSASNEDRVNPGPRRTANYDAPSQRPWREIPPDLAAIAAWQADQDPRPPRLRRADGRPRADRPARHRQPPLPSTKGRATMTQPATKPCPTCGEMKPLEDFYAHPNTRDGRHPRCKKCDNSKPRKATAAKVNRMRARHRALADLIKFHEDEFQALLAIRLAEAQEEAVALSTNPAAAEHYKEEPVRLKPGKRMPGEKAGDRIDVARCPHCIKHHDRGHVCIKCGTAPAAALRRPDDGLLDEIAVERAMSGDPVQLTKTERVEAIRRLAAKGVSDAQIAARLHCVPDTVFRWRKEHEVASASAGGRP